MTARLLHALWLLLAVLAVLAAAAFTAARLLAPLLGEYREEVERAAEAALHRPVSIERLDASWRGFYPVLEFKGIAVAGAGIGEGRLDVEQIWVGFDLWRYLFDRRLRLSRLDVIGAEVNVVRDADGRIYIDRLQNDQTTGGSTVFASALLDGGRISLHRSNITYRDLSTGRAPLRFSDVTLTLKNSAGQHILSGDVTLPEQLGQRFTVQAEFIGPLERLNDWQGRLYVTGRSLSLMPDVLKDVAPGIDAAGTADVRCWVNFGAGRLRKVTAELALDHVQLRHNGSDRSADYAAQQISGVFGWRRRDGGWQFAARDVVVTRDGARHAPLQVSVARSGTAEQGLITATAGGLYLQDLKPLVELLPGIDAAERARFVVLRPEGLIESFTLRLELSAHGPARVGWFDASLRDVAVRPSDGLPGIGGLTGSVTGTQEGGTLWINSQDFIYRDERLFNEPLHFDEFGGEAAWEFTDGRLEINSDGLHLLNGDLAADVRLALERLPDAAAPRLDLQIAVNRFQIEAIRHYLPARVMPQKSVNWLEHSLQGGVVIGGRVVLEGRLDELPFDKGEGRLEVQLPVSDALLDFSPGWTPIRNLDAQVDFTGRSMDIRSRRGKIRSASLEAVHAWIEDLFRPDLRLEGAVQGDLSVMLTELGSSPLGETYGSFVDRIESGGPAGLDLNLLIPLHHDDQEMEVNGSVILKDNRLKVSPDGPALEHIKGQLTFTTHGVSGKALKANLLDARVNVDVSTDEAAGVTRVSLDGPIDVAGFIAAEPTDPAARLIGRSDWNVQLAIGRPHGRKEIPQVDLALRSDLRGITINLPAPLGKAAQESRPLAIEVARVAKPDKILRFAYADLLSGICALRETDHGRTCSRAGIHFGAGHALLPDAKLLRITGHLPTFSLTRWQPVLDSVKPGSNLPVKLDLTIDELEILQQAVHDVTLQAEEAGLVQVFTLDGPGSAGSIELTRTGAGVEKVTMNLERLFLASHPVAGAAPSPPPQAGNFPELQITVRKFKYNGVNYGELQLQARRKAGASHLDRLVLDSNRLQLEATGDWQTHDGKNLSQFDVEVKQGKLDKLLKEYKYKEDMSGGKLNATLHGSWQGAPWEFTPARVNGKLHVLITDGQLLGVEPGAGRVLGLLSLHTLQRRLSLDFSDLFSKGFAFDRIEGNFVLDNGNAYTNDLVINGPAARIEIAGRIGLANSDYDETVTVIPSMTSTIPLAGAIAGGPAIGAALFVAERLLGDELEKASRFTHQHYAVTGPWSDPVFTKIELPPAEKADKTPATVRE